MNNLDFGIGSVIRVKCASGLEVIGVLLGIEDDCAILRKQNLIRHKFDDGEKYFLLNVTVDSFRTARTKILLDSIIMCEYVNFDDVYCSRTSFMDMAKEYEEEALRDIKAQISMDKFNPRQLRFYTEDGFCIKNG